MEIKSDKRVPDLRDITHQLAPMSLGLDLEALHAEMEDDLCQAIEALDAGDMITVRQCAGRVLTGSITMWQQERRAQNVDHD